MRINLAVSLVYRGTHTTDTLWHSTKSWGFYHTLVIIRTSNAVVVCVADIDLHITPFFIVKRRDSAWFIKRCLECCIVHKVGVASSEPAKYLISERIHHLNLVIIGVSYDDYVFLWDEVNTQRMLQLSFYSNTICVSVRMQIARVRITAYKIARTF